MRKHIITLFPGLHYYVSFDGQFLKIDKGRKISVKGKVSFLPHQRGFEQYRHTAVLLRVERVRKESKKNANQNKI